MADDRYNWLDNDAAERLLRGEPVGTTAPGAPALARLLADAAPADPGPAPLPGEEAALAAFRRARNDLPARPGARAPSRVRAGLARPFRRGIVVALAACALGGVAVAAGTGVLPSPFSPGPTPATSVSTDATPGALESPAASGTTAPGTPDATAGGRPTGPATVSPTPDTSPGATVPPSSGASRSPGRGVPGVPGNGKNGSAERRTVVLALCRDYEAGKRGEMDRETVQRLERAAGGPAKVHAFCRRYLQQQGSGDGSGGGDGDGAGSGGESGHGGGGGGNAGGGQGGGKGGGDEDDDGQPSTAPSSPAPAPSSPAPDASDPAATPTPTPTPSPGTASPASAVPPGTASRARAVSPDTPRPVAV